METAGAERGYLLLPKVDQKDTLYTAAESVDDIVEIHVSDDTSVKPDICEGVSTLFNLLLLWLDSFILFKITNYVKRTLSSVVLANASSDKQWRSDAYIVRIKAKSVLCIPFARQGTLEAILYLEYAYILFQFITIVLIKAQEQPY